MTRKKQQRYEKNSTDPLIIQYEDSRYDTCRGRWSEIFGNDNPIVLELACGKWHYSTTLAQHHPDKNYIWVDVKWNRLRYGAHNAHENNLTNVRFLRAIIQNLDDFFADGEISEIRIIHPDPRPKNADRKRRLTYKRFLTLYKKLLWQSWSIHLKTDDTDLFQYSLEQFIAEKFSLTALTFDVHNSDLLERHYGIITDYEQEALDEEKKIKYCEVRV